MKSTRILLAATFSIVLHLAVGIALVIGGRFTARGTPAASTSVAHHARMEEGSGSLEPAALPVEVEPTGPYSPESVARVAAAPRRASEPKVAAPAGPKATTPPLTSRDAEPKVFKASPQLSMASAPSTKADGAVQARNPNDGVTANHDAREPAREAPGDHEAMTPPRAVPTVNHAALHQAMQVAASQASPGVARFTQPVIRVDPQEKNLDRAWSRAFAWAFATDRSFFDAAPVGRARFVVELADDGRIREVLWAPPAAPSRLQALILRMVKLLSVNHFSPPSPQDERPRERGFEMIVAESQVTVPKQDSPVDGQSGDIWMMGAGETPTPGHPSNPIVADVTGHKISCVLKILVPPPTLP